MKRNTLIILILLLAALTACSAKPEKSEVEVVFEQIEAAVYDAVEGIEKQSVTKVMKFPFTDGERVSMIIYICTTTYYAQDPSTVTGLNTDAISAVFDLDSAELLEEFTVEGYSAAIYQCGDWNYACWTTDPEATGVMQYDPDAISLEDVHKTVESVYIPPDSGESE